MPTDPDLRQLETSSLMDMLAAYTADYTRMLNTGDFSEEEYAKHKLTIQAIQAEINLRNKTKSDQGGMETSITPPPDYE